MAAPDRMLHHADCDVWEIAGPASGERLYPEAGYDAATERYLVRIAPAYERLGRVMAQLSGVFLLALTRDASRAGLLALDHPIFTVARDQLAEARELIGGAVAPEAARRHRAGLVDLADRLAEAAAGMDKMAVRAGLTTFEADKRDVLKQLASAQRLLIATAEPEAGIVPVDFENACCNCATGSAIARDNQTTT